MKAVPFFAILALCLCVSQPVLAQTYVTPDENGDIKYDPEQRFAVPVNKNTGLSGATNVVMKEVNYDGLPEFIQKQVDLISKDCVNDEKAARNLRFYRYTSDMTRDNGLSPNYLVDLATFADKTQKSCIVGLACEKGECYLVGYNSSAYEQWGLHFMARQSSWAPKKTRDPKTDMEMTLIDIASKDSCKTSRREASMQNGEKVCNTSYIWLDTGFVQHEDKPIIEQPTKPVSREVKPPVVTEPAEAAPEGEAGEP